MCQFDQTILLHSFRYFFAFTCKLCLHPNRQNEQIGQKISVSGEMWGISWPWWLPLCGVEWPLSYAFLVLFCPAPDVAPHCACHVLFPLVARNVVLPSVHIPSNILFFGWLWQETYVFSFHRKRYRWFSLFPWLSSSLFASDPIPSSQDQKRRSSSQMRPSAMELLNVHLLQSVSKCSSIRNTGDGCISFCFCFCFFVTLWRWSVLCLSVFGPSPQT